MWLEVASVELMYAKACECELDVRPHLFHPSAAKGRAPLASMLRERELEESVTHLRLVFHP